MRNISPFETTLKAHGVDLSRSTTKTLQINIGKLCNQACLHCHVEAGPTRTENMTLSTIERLIELIEKSPFLDTVDLTGGAPELNPHFRFFVKQLRQMNKTVIDRCNLSVLFEPNQEDTAEFLKEHQVQISASLPCYSKSNVDKQRGKGVFDKSIEALKWLNKLGYAKSPSLTLDLVYNPLGPHLPADQTQLEATYKQELKELFDIEFNRLFTITNMPIKRFRQDLKRQNKLESYYTLLEDNFNPQAASQVMCRDLISIGWDGKIYDCDFNQMLEMPLGQAKEGLRDIWEIDSFAELEKERIAFAPHCYGCTAGAGSSCKGTITDMKEKVN